MHAESLIEVLLFFTLFLFGTAGIFSLSKFIRLPYTVLLLLLGLGAQVVATALDLDRQFFLPTEVTYFLLLPILLFESAMHINVHQFRLQFKTITFISTFGLLVSIASIAFLLSWMAGLPMDLALLFGAVISATDPIAVLAIFKELGAPRRLALLADGESMFNDATGVIAFRLVSGIVIGAQSFGTSQALESGWEFLVIFVGSIGFGAILGYIVSTFISQIQNDRLVETTLTAGLALGSFVAAEHFFHLSGVITVVAAGIVMGNIGRTRISADVIHFMEEFWEYIGFLCLSLIFFFSTFTLDFDIVTGNPWLITSVIIAVMIGRAISVYLSFFVTNTFSLFANEPNVPLSWQHVLTWGGLRGIIPLVLVYSIPDSYIYKEILLQCTLSAFLFTLFINATTIKKLLFVLNLHLPRIDERLMNIENEIFAYEEAKTRLQHDELKDMDQSIVTSVKEKLTSHEMKLKSALLSHIYPHQLEHALRLQAIEVERDTIKRLFDENHISEAIYFQFDAELDLQQDTLEYPQLSVSRSLRSDGMIDSSAAFRKRLLRARDLLHKVPFVGKLIPAFAEEQLVLERLGLLQARILAGTDVISYIEKVRNLMTKDSQFASALTSVQSDHEHMRLRNHYQMQAIARDYPRIFRKFELKLVETYAWSQLHTS